MPTHAPNTDDEFFNAATRAAVAAEMDARKRRRVSVVSNAESTPPRVAPGGGIVTITPPGGGTPPTPLPAPPMFPGARSGGPDMPGGYVPRFNIPRDSITYTPTRTNFIDFPPYKYTPIPGKKRKLREIIHMRNAPRGAPSFWPTGTPLPPWAIPVHFASYPWQPNGGGGGGVVLAMDGLGRAFAAGVRRAMRNRGA